jgi:hypothetical protein
MYARAVRLLGRRASWRTQVVLRRLADTTSRTTAPTGDLAYWGRSQAANWTLSSAAYGLAATTHAQGISHAGASRYRALADRLLGRLAAYRAGPRGEWVVPSVRQSLTAGRRSVDYYAHAPEYTGLALVYLNWAIELLPRGSTRGTIVADRTMRTIVGQGRSRFAVVRQRSLWYAVRETGTGGFRYDFGPIAVKRLEGGVWRDLVPLRPTDHGATGPVLRLGGRSGVPVGHVLRVARDASVLIRGGFRTGRRWLRRGVSFRVSPVRCGLALTFQVRAGDRYEYNAFFPGHGPGERGPSYGRVGDRQVLFSESVFSARFRATRPSPSDARLTRARFSIKVAKSGWLHMALC